jgi:hypothetical protein
VLASCCGYRLPEPIRAAHKDAMVAHPLIKRHTEEA